MQASIVDIRYKMAQVLSALERREQVEVLYHGKVKGVILPVSAPSVSTAAHAFFGSTPDDGGSVVDQMTALRGGRYRDL